MAAVEALKRGPPIAAAFLSLTWLCSLLLPVFYTATPETWAGWQVAALGWMGAFVFQFGWYANLVLPIAIVLIARKSDTMWVNFLTAALLIGPGCHALQWKSMQADGPPVAIRSFGMGYYLWLTAVFGSATTLLGLSIEAWRSQR